MLARRPRIHYPGAVYHVMPRGNGGQDILTDLGRPLGRDLSSLSQAVNRLRIRMEKNPALARALDRVRQDPAEMHMSQT
jgi:hypothetical protein